jgi:hypothetical protein
MATVAAIEQGSDRVFCPDESGRSVYEHPAEARAQVVADVRRLQDELPRNELLDTLVIGADHPIIQAARDQWEQEHAGAAPRERPA